MNYYIFIILFLFCFKAVNAQDSNFDIIRNLFSESSIKIIEKNNNYGIDEITLAIKQSEASWLLEQMLVKNASDNNIKVMTKGGNKLNANILNIKIEYLLHENNDSLKRNIEVDIFASVLKNNEIIDISPKSIVYSDIITFDALDKIQSEEYMFANGDIPKKRVTFFEQYIEPIIITSAAILTVVLFFTIRSS